MSKILSKEELEKCINKKLKYKDIALEYNCSTSLVKSRMNEYKLGFYSDLLEKINSSNSNGMLTIENIEKIKGKYKFLCQCKCGKKILLKISAFRGSIKSCGCLKPRVNGKLTKTILSRIKNKAKDRNIDFNLTLEYLKEIYTNQNGKCMYSNTKLTFPLSCNDYSYTASLDRIDSSKGYIEGNVQWVDKRINSMKNDMSEKEFINFCRLVSNHRTKE